MKNFTKIVRLGTSAFWRRASEQVYASIFCKIEFKDGRLSITGVEGPMQNGDAYGGCGQIVMSLLDADLSEYFHDFAPGWDADKVTEFLKVWDRWHLNDMKAGSPAQEDWLRQNPIAREDYAYPKSYYEVASQRLDKAGLNPEGGKYGHKWNREEVPEDVLSWLAALPDTDKQPAWV